MDIVLINPPHVIVSENMWRKIDRCLPPLGLASIAAFLENKGIKVEIIDVGAEGISLDTLAQRLKKSQPAFVGITAATVLIDQAKAIARAARQTIPAAKIILGGVHPTIACAEVLNFPEVDYVVRQEGEETCLELIRTGRPQNVAGLSFKSGGRLIHNPDRPFIPDIDLLPAPAYHLLPMRLYRPSTGNYKRMPAASIVSSRGCPGRCTFCFTDCMGKSLRIRSAGHIIEEIKALQKDYGIREISFYDDTFTANRANVREFCRSVRAEKLDITWSCMSRIDCVDPQILKAMAGAGCHQIGYGIESADETILANINKPIALDKVKETVRFTKAAGISARGMFMLGNPGETMATMHKTLKLAIDLDCDLAVFNIATPYPGTQMFQWADQNGYLLTKDWAKYDLSHSVMRLPTVEPRQVDEFYRYAYRKFYLRPRYIFKRLVRLSSPRELLSAAGFFAGLVKDRIANLPWVRKHLPWLSLAIVFWYFALPAIRSELLDFGGDSAQYVILAESISRGLGYQMTNYPGDPFCFLYPPVFPGILSLVAALFGRDLYLMSFLISLLGCSGIILIYRLLKNHASKSLAYLTALSLAVNANYIVYSAKFIRSEIPYIFFSCAALLAVGAYLKAERWSCLKGWSAAVLLVLAYFTRYFGLTLFAAAVLALAASRTAQKAKKILLISAVFLAPFTVWQAAKFFYPGPKISQLAVLVSGDTFSLSPRMLPQSPGLVFLRLLDGISYYSYDLASNLLPQAQGWAMARLVWVAAAFGLVLLGGWTVIRRSGPGVLGYYTGMAVVLAACWPYRDGARLILPVMAFLVFYFWAGLNDICRRISAGKIIFICSAAAILILSAGQAGSVSRFSLASLGPNFQNLLKVNYWMKENLADQGLIMFCKPDIASYYTGHKAVVYPLSADPDATWTQVKAKKIKYMLADGFSKEDRLYLAPFVNKYADKLKLRYSSGNCAVFEVLAWSS